MDAPRGPQADPRAPRYAAIADLIALSIEEGRLPPGLVLTEDPIARLVGTSRTPVRMALGTLLDRGVLERFDGRGFLVRGAEGPEGGTRPVRARLTAPMLGIADGLPADPQPAAAARIARDVEERLAGALPFGSWRISEQAAADHYEVSRTVIREVLSRLEDRGLVRKDRSHWVIGPLTARDIAHYFAVRGRLEPLALLDSAPRIPAREIAAMRQRIEEGLARGAAMGAAVFDALETDLHVTLLARSPNRHLLRMIRQSQLALVVNRVFAATVGTQSFVPAFREHAIVLEFITRGSHGLAAQALEEHLRLSASRTRQRLMAISVFPEPELPRYLTRVEDRLSP